MKKTLYVYAYQSSKYRKMLKVLMLKLGVGIDDLNKFDTEKNEEIQLTIKEDDVAMILAAMNSSEFIICK